MQRRHKTYASARRASVPDGVCTMSDDSLASAKPRWSQKQWKPVIRAVCIIVPEHSIVANLYKNTLVHKIRRGYEIKCKYHNK